MYLVHIIFISGLIRVGLPERSFILVAATALMSFVAVLILLKTPFKKYV